MSDTKKEVYDEHTERPLSISDDTEKARTHDADFLQHDQSNEESTDPRITQFSHAEQRKIVHRVDRRLTVTLGVMYAICE